MSLSSLFNLPSAPAQILSENATASPNTSNANAPQGDAFATYMAQQMSSGQFSNWQNLTSALANQNALGGANNLGSTPGSTDATSGFGPAHGLASTHPDSNTQSAQNTQSDNSSRNSTSTSSSNTSTSTSQANPYVAHRKFNAFNKDQSLLGDSLDSSATASDSTDSTSSGSTSSTQGADSVSTNAWLMNASSARSSAQDALAPGNTNAQPNNSKTAGLSSSVGALPIVLPSIGAALQAQQIALKAQADQSASGKGSEKDLKTTSLSDKVQLITPNQSDTNPQSLVSFAQGMGLNASQIHQLFGADAVKANANAGPNANGAGQTSASTAAIIGSGAGSGAVLASTNSSLDANSNSPSITTNTDTTSLANSSNAMGNDQALGSLSPTASSVLSQVSNLQVQIDQAPGATGIQNDATATTLADLNAGPAGVGSAATAGLAGIAGLTGAANKTAPASTLEVLSVMDASLRPEDVAALQAHFEGTGRSSGALNTGSEGSSISIDMNTALTSMGADSTALGLAGDNSGTGSGTNSGNAFGGDANQQANNGNVPADMAGAYEKLSNKFANEVSTRLQEQFAQGQWKMKFALRPTSLGIVDIQLEMKDGKLAANFQSNNPLTQNLIQTNSHQLRNALQGSGISQSSVQVGSGQTNGQGSSSGQNSGVPYTYQSNPLNTQATATEEIPLADDSTTTKSTNSDSQLDIFA